jgi:hypothetical protein
MEQGLMGSRVTARKLNFACSSAARNPFRGRDFAVDGKALAGKSAPKNISSAPP